MQSSNLPDGVLLTSLAKAAEKYPELLQKYYGKLADTSEDAMVALNTAFAKDGYLLYIPKNVVIESAIQIISLLRSDKNAFATQRNLVCSAEEARQGANCRGGGSHWRCAARAPPHPAAKARSA